MHPNRMMRAQTYPFVLLKNARDNDTIAEGHPVSPLQHVGAQGLLPHPDLVNGQSQGLGGSSPVSRSYDRHHASSIKALKGITHPSKALGATPAGCARAHPPDSLLKNKTKQIKSYPWSLVLKPLKECSTPPQARGLLSSIKMPGYPTNRKIQHPARSLKPHRRGPVKPAHQRH
jgi:hypothetical protein